MLIIGSRIDFNIKKKQFSRFFHYNNVIGQFECWSQTNITMKMQKYQQGNIRHTLTLAKRTTLHSRVEATFLFYVKLLKIPKFQVQIDF